MTSESRDDVSRAISKKKCSTHLAAGISRPMVAIAFRCGICMTNWSKSGRSFNNGDKERSRQMIRDKMRRAPDGTIFMPGQNLNVQRAGDKSLSHAKEAQMYDIDEGELRNALTNVIAKEVQRSVVAGVLAATDPAARSKFHLQQGIRALLKGMQPYQLPQGVQDELQRWSDILGLSLTALSDLLRNIQAGVVAASGDAPPPQNPEVEFLERSFRTSPHRFIENPLYCEPRHVRRFAY
jgi:hypothetical protein